MNNDISINHNNNELIKKNKFDVSIFKVKNVDLSLSSDECFDIIFDNLNGKDYLLIEDNEFSFIRFFTFKQLRFDYIGVDLKTEGVPLQQPYLFTHYYCVVECSKEIAEEVMFYKYFFKNATLGTLSPNIYFISKDVMFGYCSDYLNDKLYPITVKGCRTQFGKDWMFRFLHLTKRESFFSYKKIDGDLEYRTIDVIMNESTPNPIVNIF